MVTENEITQSKQSGAGGFGNVSARSELQAVGDLPRSQGAEGWHSAGRLSRYPLQQKAHLRDPSCTPFPALRQKPMCCQLSNKVLSLDLQAL